MSKRPTIIGPALGMTKKTSCSATVKSAKNGFALIATISILVLLALISVGLLSLSTVTVRSASNSDDLAIARANARLALSMAIGQLQKELGPDQRVSVPANLSTPNAPQWVGVYDSWIENPQDAGQPINQNTATNRPNPTFRSWLISGDPARQTDIMAPATGISNNTVTLVGPGTLGSNPNPGSTIDAGIINGPDGSGLAWYTSDESMKASLPKSQATASSAIDARANMMAANSTGIQMFDSLSAVSRNDPNLDRVFSMPSSSFLSNANSGTHFHDLTDQSKGVLSNLRFGGLQKDLSFLLEYDDRDQRRRSELENTILYEVAGSPGDTGEGIHLGELADFYHLDGELSKSTAVRHPDGSSLPSDGLVLESARSHQGVISDPFHSYKRLTILRCSWVVSLTAVRSGSSYKLYLVLDPILTVWNPYDVAITIDRRAYQGFRFWGIPYQLDLIVGKQRLLKKPLNDIIGAYIMNARYGRSEPITLRPGEVQVVSLGPSASRTQQGNSSAADVVDLRLGWNFASGYRYEIQGFADLQQGDEIRGARLSPSPSGHLRVALVEFLHYQGDTSSLNNNNSVWLGGLMIDRSLDAPGAKGRTLLADAQAADHLFSTVSLGSGREFSIGDILNRKEPLMFYSLDMKTEVDPRSDASNPPLYQGRFSLRHNPKLPIYDIQSWSDQTLAMFPMQLSAKALNSFKDPILEVSGSGLGYSGGRYSSGSGSSYIVTHSIPREPIFSIAAFQHSVANGVRYQFFEDHTHVFDSFLGPSASRIIGNSFASPLFRPSDVSGSYNSGSPAADHSFMANHALWDDYFFSSIAPQDSISFKDSDQTKSQQQAWADFAKDSTAELPNRRMERRIKDYTDANNQLFDAASRRRDDAHLKAAAFLMVDGRFNVNSTSVNAWTALLASQWKSDVATSSPAAGGKDTDLESSDGAPVAGLLTALDGEIEVSSDPSEESQWLGYRSLSENQIKDLATSIVNQVRLRGPFLSLSDFVNRRLGSDKALAVSGALQSALDDPNVDINSLLNSNSSRSVSTTEARGQGLEFPEAEQGAAAVGMPAYVKQADILTSIGPMLSARGDTFRIRVYGESTDQNGQILARAYAEATVQRVPDFVDSADEAWKDLASLTSPSNKEFGRRFVVTSFRWLSPNEV